MERLQVLSSRDWPGSNMHVCARVPFVFCIHTDDIAPTQAGSVQRGAWGSHAPVPYFGYECSSTENYQMTQNIMRFFR